MKTSTYAKRAAAAVEALMTWNAPGIDPKKPGEFNVSVFDPSVANTRATNVGGPGFRTIYVRFWNGKLWSRPYLLKTAEHEKVTLRKTPTTLRGDDARYWWRDVAHLQVAQ